MNESFTKSRYDCLLFTFLFAFTGPTEHCGLENSCGPYRATVADFQTFEKEEQTKLLTMQGGC
jgi:hypothetical protein